MNPIKFVKQRPFFSLMLVIAILGGGIFGLYKMRLNIPGVNTSKIYVQLDTVNANAIRLKGRVVSQYEAYFHKAGEEGVHVENHKLIVTSPLAKDVIITQEYVCQIHSQRHIEIQALESGYLEAIPVKEGQAVKKGDLMFKVVPILYESRLEAEIAEVQLAQLEYDNTKRLYDSKNQAVSLNEVYLFNAKLLKAKAKKKLAEAEFDFATIKAPFDGIVDRLLEQQGSLVKEGDSLTTLSDNSVMWVYFNVPERRYLEYMAELGQNEQSPDIELRLANFNKFPYTGKIGAIEAKFDNTTGNIPFRADFPNPDRLLRHGQTGTVVISRSVKNAILIPQRATYETLAKRYVFVVDKEDVIHQREIIIQYELEDIFVIERGLDPSEKIVLEGVRQVRDGEKVEFEFIAPEKVMRDQKNHAE